MSDEQTAQENLTAARAAAAQQLQQFTRSVRWPALPISYVHRVLDHWRRKRAWRRDHRRGPLSINGRAYRARSRRRKP